MRISLDGEWEFRQADGGKTMRAEVPGCNFTDLINNGEIPDPFCKTNEKDLYWIGEKDWLYSRTFHAPKDALDASSVRLVFEKLDTLAEVKLNGIKVLYAQNYHLKYEIDVKSVLREGDNLLEVRFFSPVAYVNKKQKEVRCPRNNNGLDGIPHLRKPQYQFGWDWGPVLTPSGIVGSVYLECVNKLKIRGMNTAQCVDGNTARIEATLDVENFSGEKPTYVFTVFAPNGKELHTVRTENTTTVFEVENPELWQTYERAGGKPPLYSIVVTAELNGIELDRISRKIGLRTIELDRGKDKYGENFRFVLNGEPVFAKGANWIPPDSFPSRVTVDTLRFYIVSAVEAGFNMLRVWGGGYYESEEFYSLCDEYGILVWQDFCFACQPYPFFLDDFRENVLDEVRSNALRLKEHPSLAVWCGNVEIEVLSLAWKTYRRFNEWTEKFFYDILPRELRSVDGVTPYIPGSPIGKGYMDGVSSDDSGDTHLWAVWHGMQNTRYYRGRFTRFCSEFGFESFPSERCISRFADESDRRFDSEVFRAHQKCPYGNEKLVYYVASRFRLPKKFEDYVYLSQLCQSECVSDAAEHWRRNFGRCNGALFWQYNDCWPTCSWASVDYLGGYKALQYDAKSFFRSVAVSIEDGKDGIGLYLLNDLLSDRTVEVRARLTGFDGTSYLDETLKAIAKRNSAERIKFYSRKDFKCDNLKDCVFSAELVEDGKTADRKTVLFDRERNLELPKSQTKVDISVADGKARYLISSSVYVRKLMLTSGETAPFSNNYFDVLPGESLEITQPTSLTAEELSASFSTTDASHIESAHGKLADKLIRAKIMLRPMNVLSYIYYKWLI